MDQNTKDQKDQKVDGRRTSPIRGGKGRNKPGAGKRGGNPESKELRKNTPSRGEGTNPSDRVRQAADSIFTEFENVAEQRIRQVIEEEMSEAETRILARLTGRQVRKEREGQQAAA